MKKLLNIIVVALLTFGLADAKMGSSSSSSRSSPSRSSSSSVSKPSSPSKSSSWSKPNTSKPQTSSRPTSNVDTAKYKAAVQSGKTFETRDSAIKDFKTSKASTYTSKYSSEPAKRPEHIPTDYKDSSGKSYNITYNQAGGGYGYWNGGGPGLGTFMLYDMMSDQLMMNRMMEKNNYYIGAPPSSGTSSGFIWVMLIITLVIGVGIVVVIYKTV